MLRTLVVAAAVVALTAAPSPAFAKARIFVDGPLTKYLAEPPPTFDKPIAQTISLERVSWNTAASGRAVILSDLVGQGFYMLRPDVGEQVRTDMKLDDAWSKDNTMAAFETIAANRDEARTILGRKASKVKHKGADGDWVTPQWDDSTMKGQEQAYVERETRLAQEAHDRGDFLGSEIHRSAAMNEAKIAGAFDPAIGLAQTFASSQAALAQTVTGQALKDFDHLRHYLSADLGLVGPGAPAGTHLSVFLLEYFDANKFGLDSRQRVAVLAVRVDAEGHVTKVLEGSDIQTCIGKRCGNGAPKPTAVEMNHTMFDPKLVSTFTIDNFESEGLLLASAPYEKTLLLHALKRLAETP